MRVVASSRAPRKSYKVYDCRLLLVQELGVQLDDAMSLSSGDRRLLNCIRPNDAEGLVHIKLQIWVRQTWNRGEHRRR